MGGPSTAVYCVDASACALLSEDYPATTRWHLQRELVACHSQACLVGSAGDTPAASSQQQQQQVVLIAGSGGRASVALHPTTDGSALQQALDGVRPAGEGNLMASLKLALLVCRRFQQHTARVTAFVASAGGAASLAAEGGAALELRQSFLDAGLALDVAVLCPREELGEAAACALEALAGGGSASTNGSSSSSSSSSVEAACSGGADAAPSCTQSGSGAADVRSASPSLRLVWLQPVATAAESWQQLEAALELLEGGREASGGSAASRGQLRGATGGAGTHPSLPAQISRAPRQLDPLSRPRTALLAPRSGLPQPALCRGESLSRLGHLSSDGMMRPWLPTYSSLGKQATRGAASPVRGAAGAPGNDFCFVEVQPVPRWRTLLKVAAGRMLPTQPGPGASDGGDYAAASSQMLRSLQALSVMDEAEQGSSSGGSDSGGGRDSGGEGGDAGPPHAPLRYSPDLRRGMLRLLQGTKEPHLLRLVWRAEPDRSAASAAEQPDEAPPLDMFGRATPGGAGGGTPSSRHAELLTYMPASAVASSAARGPLLMEGCELWEAAAEFEWELPLPTADLDDEAGISGPAAAGGGRESGAADGELPAAVEARRLPNGAQVLLVTPTLCSGSGKSRRGQRRRSPATAAFWLQQCLGPDGLQLPTYGTASSSLPAAAATAHQPAFEPTVPAEGTSVGRADEQQLRQPPQAPAGGCLQPQATPAGQQGEEGGEAALLAAALLGALRQPPRVDLRRLRRDVKSGAIQVTPITVGPLPARFVRDIVSARSAMLGGMGVENLDSWEGEREPGKAGSELGAGSGAGSGASGGSSDSASSAAGSGAGSADVDAARGTPGAGLGGSSKKASLLSEAALKQHRAAAYLLLRQRLSREPTRGSGEGSAIADGSTGAGAAPRSGAQAAAPSDGDCVRAAPVPCSSPLATPAAPRHLSDSCCSSAADSPFGTPLHIYPGRLVHQRRSFAFDQAGTAEGSEGAAAGMPAAEAEADAASAQAVPGLPGAAEGCLKREGSSVLASAGSQADGAADSLDPMFRLE